MTMKMSGDGLGPTARLRLAAVEQGLHLHPVDGQLTALHCITSSVPCPELDRSPLHGAERSTFRPNFMTRSQTQVS